MEISSWQVGFVDKVLGSPQILNVDVVGSKTWRGCRMALQGTATAATIVIRRIMTILFHAILKFYVLIFFSIKNP